MHRFQKCTVQKQFITKQGLRSILQVHIYIYIYNIRSYAAAVQHEIIQNRYLCLCGTKIICVLKKFRLSLFSSSFSVYLLRQTHFYGCCYAMFSMSCSLILKRNMFLQLLVAGRVVLLRLFDLQLPGGVLWNVGQVTYLARLYIFLTLFQFCVTLAAFLGLLCCNITPVWTGTPFGRWCFCLC